MPDACEELHIKALINVKSFASNNEFCCVTQKGELPFGSNMFCKYTY